MYYDIIPNVNIFKFKSSWNIYNKHKPSNLQIYFQSITALKLKKYHLFMNWGEGSVFYRVGDFSIIEKWPAGQYSI